MGDTAFITLIYSNGEKKIIRVGQNHGINAVVASQFATNSEIVAISYRYNDFEYATSRAAINATKRELKLYGISCKAEERDGVLYFIRDFSDMVCPR